MRRIKYFMLLLGTSLLLKSCVGEDIIPDPEEIVEKRPKKIELSTSTIGLLPGDTSSLLATFWNDLGEIDESISFEWSSEDESVATVDQNGFITALSSGSTNIIASYDTLIAITSVNVVLDSIVASGVTITFDKNTLNVGESIPVEVIVINLAEERLDTMNVSWIISDTDILDVIDNQLVAKSEGMVMLHVMSNGLMSGSFMIEVTSGSRTVNFKGLNGYVVSGTGDLSEDDNGDIILELNNDFSVGSFGPGIYVYLSNEEGSISGGFEVAKITQSGNHVFNLTELGFEGDLNTYNLVEIYCKPFNIGFGSGELK